MQPKTKALIPLCLVLLIDAIGGGMIFPILPELFLNKQYGLLLTYPFHVANILYGLSLAIFPLAGLVAMPMFGGLSDQYGRKRLILSGLSIILLSYLVSIIALLLNSAALFIISRAITGLGIGTYTVAFAMISDLNQSQEAKMSAFRWPTLAMVMGFIIGPMVGGSSVLFVGKLSLLIPFIVSMVLTLINLALVKIMLVETYSGYKPQKLNLLMLFTDPLKRGFTALKQNKALALLASYAALHFALGLYIQSLSLYLAEGFHYTSGQLSFFFIVMAIGIAFNVLFLQNYIQSKIKVHKIVYLSLGVILAMYISQYLVTQCFPDQAGVMLTAIFITSFFIFICFNMSMNGYMSLFASSVDAHNQGAIMGMTGQVYSMMWFISGLSVGYLVLTHELLLLSNCIAFMIMSLVFFVNFNKGVPWIRS